MNNDFSDRLTSNIFCTLSQLANEARILLDKYAMSHLLLEENSEEFRVKNYSEGSIEPTLLDFNFFFLTFFFYQ